MKSLLFLTAYVLSAHIVHGQKRLPSTPPTRYRIEAEAQGRMFPFWLSLTRVGKGGTRATIQNGHEVFSIMATKAGDTLVFPLRGFDADLKLLKKGKKLTGYYVRYDTKAGRVPIPLQGSEEGVNRFARNSPPSRKIFGRYQVTFSDPDGSNPYPAVGLFTQKGPYLEGTFETETGDYRFLEGQVAGDSLYLSCFDGAHLFLFIAKATARADSLTGIFFSGKSGKEIWTGVRNDTAHLSDPLSLSKPATAEPVIFTAPDTAGHTVSLDDERFKGKAVILQVMGTWCPNCLDETQYLAQWYRSTERPANVEVLALAFERKQDPAYFKERIRRLKQVAGLPYPAVLAGPANNNDASARLPFISKVAAFPTTIFLDREHRVRYVHTGFSGPATGAGFEEYKKEFARLVGEISGNK